MADVSNILINCMLQYFCDTLKKDAASLFSEETKNFDENTDLSRLVKNPGSKSALEHLRKNRNYWVDYDSFDKIKHITRDNTRKEDFEEMIEKYFFKKSVGGELGWVVFSRISALIGTGPEEIYKNTPFNIKKFLNVSSAEIINLTKDNFVVRYTYTDKNILGKMDRIDCAMCQKGVEIVPLVVGLKKALVKETACARTIENILRNEFASFNFDFRFDADNLVINGEVFGKKTKEGILVDKNLLLDDNVIPRAAKPWDELSRHYYKGEPVLAAGRIYNGDYCEFHANWEPVNPKRFIPRIVSVLMNIVAVKKQNKKLREALDEKDKSYFELQQKDQFIRDNLKNTAKGQLQNISEIVHQYHQTQDIALLREAGTIYSLLENNLDLIKDTLTDSERSSLERRVIPLFAYELDEGIKGTRAERQITYSTNDVHAVKSVDGLRFKSYKKPIAGKTEKIVLEAIAKINEAKNTGNFTDIGDIFGLSAENTEKLSPEIPLIRIPKFAYLPSRQRENDIVLCTDYIFGEDMYDILPELNHATAQGDDFAKQLKLAYFFSMNEKLAFLQHVNWEQIGVKETENMDFSKDLEDSLTKLASHFGAPKEGIAGVAACFSKDLHDKRLVNYRDYNAKHVRLYFRAGEDESSLDVMKNICKNEGLSPTQFIEKYAFDIDFDKFYRLVSVTEDRVNDRDCRYQLSEPETKLLNCHFLLNDKKFGYLFEGRGEAGDVKDMLRKLAAGEPCPLGSELVDYGSDINYNLYRRDMRTAALTLGLLESSAQPEPDVALKHLSRAKTTVEELPDRFVFLRELTSDLLAKAEAKYER